MTASPRPAPTPRAWPWVLCLVGVDYFSTLAYLPSMAVEAAGSLAPVAAGAVVLVTFLLALPVYWYVVGRSPEGRGATGMLEELIPGWRGKLVVLSLLGFAAADFVITRSLSLADAAIHLIHNPHGQRLLATLPERAARASANMWPPLAAFVQRLADPPVATTVGLSILSFAVWQVFKRGLTQRILFCAAATVGCYLALSAIVIGSAVAFLLRHAEIWEAWRNAIFAPPATSAAGGIGWWRPLVGAVWWSFPQIALGLSGFEMTMTIVPQVSGGRETDADPRAGRARNTRKLMLVAASIMAIYLTSAVVVTTLLIPRESLGSGGLAEHRALAYLAHGSPLAADGASISPLFGELFGDLYDLSSALILCLAGATVTLSLQNLLPHYLNRLGMDVSWAGRVTAILHVLNAIILIVTVVFRASPSSQQWAYATSVLVLLSGAALAAAIDLWRRRPSGVVRALGVGFFAVAGLFFVTMTSMTLVINASGLALASAFVVGILISSFVSRWIRSTELRFEGFDFFDAATRQRWDALCRSGPKVLAPHRPGLISLTEKYRTLERDYRLNPATPLIFIEATLGDPSNFYQRPLMRIERDGEFEVIRVSSCVSVAHVLAAVCLELCRDGGDPPEIIFGWSHESPLAANLNFLFLGEGNIPWMVKELVRQAMHDEARQPRIVVG